MFNDPDVAEFVDAGASVSAKTAEPQSEPKTNPLDTMLQGADLTKPKLSVEIPAEVLKLQAQRKELAQRKYALLADPPPMSQEQLGNKKVRAQAVKAKKNAKNEVRPKTPWVSGDDASGFGRARLTRPGGPVHTHRLLNSASRSKSSYCNRARCLSRRRNLPWASGRWR